MITTNLSLSFQTFTITLFQTIMWLLEHVVAILSFYLLSVAKNNTVLLQLLFLLSILEFCKLV